MRILPKLEKLIRSLCPNKEEKPNKSKISLRAHIVSVGMLGIVRKTSVCMGTVGFANKVVQFPPRVALRCSLLAARSLCLPPKVAPREVLGGVGDGQWRHGSCAASLYKTLIAVCAYAHPHHAKNLRTTASAIRSWSELAIGAMFLHPASLRSKAWLLASTTSMTNRRNNPTCCQCRRANET